MTKVHLAKYNVLNKGGVGVDPLLKTTISWCSGGTDLGSLVQCLARKDGRLVTSAPGSLRG